LIRVPQNRINRAFATEMKSPQLSKTRREGGTNADRGSPLRVNDCQFALGFGSANLRKNLPEALAGSICAPGLAFAIGAPAKAWAFNRYREWKFLAAPADCLVLSGGQAEAFGDDFVNFFHDCQDTVLCFLNVVGEITNSRRKLASNGDVSRQGYVLNVIHCEFVLICREKRNLS
jgi:hypothetical protein